MNFQYLTISGQLLRQARVNKNISQSELARCLGISQPLLSQWETGRKPVKITASFLKQIPEEHSYIKTWLIDNAAPQELAKRIATAIDDHRLDLGLLPKEFISTNKGQIITALYKNVIIALRAA